MISEISTGSRLFKRDKTSYFFIYFVGVILILYILFFLFFSITPIRGKSMENTIYNDQYCLVQHSFYTIKRGDIVIINTSNTNENHDIIKRVVAVSDDKVLFMQSKDKTTIELYICKAGESYFKKQSEPYIKEQMTNRAVFYDCKILPYKANIELLNVRSDPDENTDFLNGYVVNVPKNYVYFLGDNRNVSRDSRYYGPQSKDRIEAKMLCVIY